MANPNINRKRGGKSTAARNAERDRQRDIHSKLDGLPSGSHQGHAHNLHGSSATAAVEHAAKYFESALIEERPETHLIPRQSQTRKQLLGFFPQKLEFADRKARQLDKRTGNMVETTDQRVIWKSDTTLLRRGNPFKDAEAGNAAGYKREGSISVGNNTRKFTKAVENANGTVAHKANDGTVTIDIAETILGPAIDDEPL